MEIEVQISCKVFVSFDELLPSEVEEAEFLLNWAEQVPHWELFTNKGINWLKKTINVEYKNG